MNAKNFVNYHVLFSHSPSCLNRDDMNMQKTAVFGGMNRIRISSQSLKRALRKSTYYQGLFSVSCRTRYLIDRAVDKLSSQKGSDSNTIESAGLILAALIEGKTKPADIKGYKRNDESGRIQHQVMPFNNKEITAIEALVLELAGIPENKRIDEAKARYAKVQAETRKSMDLDVALAGRMATSDLSYGSDGALAVAHAITTHTVEPQEVDWFTAVDDLTQDAGETGAGHLNKQEFSAGVFYRYASLNLTQLQVNLGLLEKMESAETPETRKRALEIAKHVFHMLATIVPTAKRQPFAADNPADFAIVSFSDMPLSLANAFEEPVSRSSSGGYLQPSINAISSYWKAITDFHSLQENAAVASSRPFDCPEGLKDLKSRSALESWIESGGKNKA
jgi:CRISPR system Cascade subunit CasC